MEKPHLTTTAFKHLPLHESLQESLEDAGLEFCTPIQEEAIPALLQGKDLTGQAQTGTGKSAAFLLSTMHYLMTTAVEVNKKGPYAIILAPTRELALQIQTDANLLGAYTGLKSVAVYGGTGYESQRQLLESGVDIIIGTVGRVVDFYKQRVFTLKNIEVVVLDEADRMFDLGFVADIRYLLKQMPAPGQRLNMLFSATFSQRVLELAYEHMNNPVMVKIESEGVVSAQISERLYHTESRNKIDLLLGILHQEQPNLTIIFVNTKRAADQVAAYLAANQYKCAVLSGDIAQNKRESLLVDFKGGNLPIMVATDVAARGLHISDVSLVINYDLPQDAEDYVHRIGRTGRAGADGLAISLACEEYVLSLEDIEDYIGRKIPVIAITDDLLIQPELPSPRNEYNSRYPRRSGHPSKRNFKKAPYVSKNSANTKNNNMQADDVHTDNI